MLKNEDLKQINNTITLLTTIKLYLLENDPTDFIDKTGIDLIDIQHSIKNLITIHTQETLKHINASEKLMRGIRPTQRNTEKLTEDMKKENKIKEEVNYNG